MWTKGHELKYWRKTGVNKGTDIYAKYKDSFNFSEDYLRDKKIIDIGCGPLGGVFCKDTHLDVTLADVLAEDYNKLGLIDKKIVHGDLNVKLPFDEGHFDLAVCTNAIDHILDVKTGFLEIHRLLKKGGKAFVHVHLRTKKQLNKAHVHVLTEKMLHAYCSVFSNVEIKVEEDWVNDRDDRLAAYMVLEK